jgi:hypothetical protein
VEEARGLTADQVSPQHQAMNVADSAAAASRRFKEGFERVEAVIARGDDRLDATAERWRERLRGRRAPGAEGVAEMQGLTADEAFQQHQATSGAGAMGGMNAMASSSVNPVWVYGGHGNPPQQQVGRDSWTGEGYGELADAVGKTDPSINPDDPNEVLDWLGKGVPVGQEEGATAWEIQPDGTVVEVPVPDPADWVPGEVVVPDEVPDAPPATGGSLLAQGLTADEAFQQHQATAGVGAMAGMSAAVGAGQEALNLGDKTGRRLPRATQVAGQAGVERAKGILEGTVPPPPDEVVQPLGAPPVQDTLFMGGGDRNPELRSMDSQMLADMMAAQVTQPDQGWLGGALGGVGGFWEDTLSQMQGTTTLPYAQQAQAQMSTFQNMSTEQKIAIVLTGLAVAAGTSGVGSPAVPPLLGGAALLNATG